MNTSQNRGLGRSPRRTAKSALHNLDGTVWERAAKQIIGNSGLQQTLVKITGNAAWEQAAKQIIGNSGLQQTLVKITGNAAWEQAAKQIISDSGFQKTLEQLKNSDALKKITGGTTLELAAKQLKSSGELRRIMTSAELTMVSESLIDQLDHSSFDEIVSDIAQDSTELDLEKFGNEKLEDQSPSELSPEAIEWIDPVREAVFKKSAEWFDKIRERYPEYSDRAINGLNKIALYTAIYWILQILMILFIADAGPLAPLIGGLAQGGGQYISEQRQEKLSLPERYGMSIRCPLCDAAPGMWCVTVRGSAPGSPASRLHKSRTAESQ